MTPRFTIALPVHNGGNYLRECVASILGQARRDFELLIFENSSTDGTREWLDELHDGRVTLYPSSHLLSIEENFARIATVVKREFVTIIGHDDLFDRNYLEVMARLIADNPTATLYQTHFRLIDGDGHLRASCSPQPAREFAAEFLAARLNRARDSFGTGYMMRSADYDAVGGMPPFPSLLFADDALWITLMERGWKATAPEECFSYRLHTTSAAGSAGLKAHTEGLMKYWAFLRVVAENDSQVAKVLAELGPGASIRFLVEWFQNWYTPLLVEATRKNSRLEPDLAREVFSIIDRAEPELGARLRPALHRVRRIRFHELINRWMLLRILYNRCQLLRRTMRRG